MGAFSNWLEEGDMEHWMDVHYTRVFWVRVFWTQSGGGDRGMRATLADPLDNWVPMLGSDSPDDGSLCCPSQCSLSLPPHSSDPAELAADRGYCKLYRLGEVIDQCYYGFVTFRWGQTGNKVYSDVGPGTRGSG